MRRHAQLVGGAAVILCSVGGVVTVDANPHDLLVGLCLEAAEAVTGAPAWRLGQLRQGAEIVAACEAEPYGMLVRLKGPGEAFTSTAAWRAKQSARGPVTPKK